ncbi:MAG TPA: hypothetical protein VFE18_19060 [Phenylobacterium sp.]|jgi:hypothetical protein|uniref:hypothetical protein n=1 Tax=Phenylobacterium sp. TaxID=1871053 RepID=UPI002D245EA0|nr:hypothetical protein [Phenylobacterium sp.]HZZ70274.1 hypothetical protein [Phenylobacterium sp.]
MLKFVFTRYLDRFERAWGYDASYMREVLAASPWSLLKFTLGTAAPQRSAAPPEAFLTAALAGTLSEDCGPCTQIGVDMAAAAGLDPAVIRAVLAGDEAAMGETASLAWRFARASLARDMETCDPLRDEIVRRWGQKALVSLGLALTASRMYPTLKYALGHGKACSKVTVAGVAAPVAHLPLAA